MREHDIYVLIADYLRYQYPQVIYRFDLAADLKLTIGQASKHKRLQRYRGYPDLFIAEPKGKNGGLYLEIKKDGTKILKKDGSYVADKHIREQAKILQALERRGYQASFAVGYEQAKRIIDDYIGRKKGGADIIEF